MNYWSEQLARILSQAAETKRRKKPEHAADPIRVAVVGVGNELNGDDAAGIWVAQNLWADREIPANCLSITAGSLPENASGPLRRFGPDLVIFVDAADFEADPGTVNWLAEEKIEGFSASSHTLPLTVLGKFLETELGCQVAYLGIQPQNLEFLTGLSGSVQIASSEIIAEIQKRMMELNTHGK